jgi:hypothetical protein
VLIYAIFNKSVEILEKRVFVNMIAEIDSENVPKTEFPIDLVNDKSFKIKILLNEKMNSSFIIEKNS